MNTYRSDINRRETPAKCVIYGDNGCEITSNDGQMRIVLTKLRTYLGIMEQEHYNSTYYINEDDGWEKVDESHTYTSISEFIRALDGAEDFTEAVREYKFNNQ